MTSAAIVAAGSAGAFPAMAVSWRAALWMGLFKSWCSVGIPSMPGSRFEDNVAGGGAGTVAGVPLRQILGQADEAAADEAAAAPSTAVAGDAEQRRARAPRAALG